MVEIHAENGSSLSFLFRGTDHTGGLRCASIPGVPENPQPVVPGEKRKERKKRSPACLLPDEQQTSQKVARTGGTMTRATLPRHAKGKKEHGMTRQRAYIANVCVVSTFHQNVEGTYQKCLGDCQQEITVDPGKIGLNIQMELGSPSEKSHGT